MGKNINAVNPTTVFGGNRSDFTFPTTSVKRVIPKWRFVAMAVTALSLVIGTALLTTYVDLHLHHHLLSHSLKWYHEMAAITGTTAAVSAISLAILVKLKPKIISIDPLAEQWAGGNII